MFELSAIPIETDACNRRLMSDQAGALCVFEGWVRDHNQGSSVDALEYQVYPELALKEGRKILLEAQEKFNILKVYCVHRHGALQIGDTAVWVGAVAAHRDDAFRATRYVIDEIKRRLPIWKKEHYTRSDAQWVFCKDHHTHVHFQEVDYYAKQARLVNQELLKAARVVVVGAGGLGCPAATALVAAGVGHVIIADADRVTISNIHRQTLYSPSVVGEKKVRVMQTKLTEMNPYVDVKGVDLHVGPDNVMELINDADLILDCTDNMRTKLLIHDACYKARVPFISASIFKYEATVRTFAPADSTPEYGCLRCSYKATPDDALLGNCNDAGVVGASVAFVGSLQASEALRFLQSGRNLTLSSTFYFNLETLEQMKIKNIPLINCPSCQGAVDFEQNAAEINYADIHASTSADYILVDIRETSADVLDEYIVADRKVAVLCQRGVRSLQAVEKMRARGLQHFYSIRGGACSFL